MSNVAACKNSEAATFVGRSADVNANDAARGSIASNHSVNRTVRFPGPPLTTMSMDTRRCGSQSDASPPAACSPASACAAPPTAPSNRTTRALTPSPLPSVPASAISAACARFAATRPALYAAPAPSTPGTSPSKSPPLTPPTPPSALDGDRSTYGRRAFTNDGKTASISDLSSPCREVQSSNAPSALSANGVWCKPR
eukprot:31354-Pelagococcus_subviridis.AAC.18